MARAHGHRAAATARLVDRGGRVDGVPALRRARRYFVDFVTLLGLVRARGDLSLLTPRDCHHLGRAVRAVGKSIDRFGVADADLGLARLVAEMERHASER